MSKYIQTPASAEPPIPPKPKPKLWERLGKPQIAFAVLIAGLTCGIPLHFFRPGDGAAHVSLSTVVSEMNAGRIASAGIADSGKAVQVRLTDGTVQDSSVSGPSQSTLVGQLSAAGADVTMGTPPRAPAARVTASRPAGEKPSHPPTAMPWWMRYLQLEIAALSLVFFGMWAYNSRRRNQMLTALGRAEARAAADGANGSHLPVGERPTTRFADIAGACEAVADLSEIVDWLKDPERYTKMGVDLPRGALLSGPTGTGKTLLARAVAGEAEVPFFCASGSDFDRLYVGSGSDTIRKLFKAARDHAPSIVFIDEIDSVGRKRGTAGGGNDERAATLNAMLSEMDGFKSKDSQVVFLAATNLPDVLDPALVRPGRLERQIHMGLPDRRGRQLILEVHAKNRPIDPAVDLAAYAARTPGMSGAQLARVVNEACMEAVRRNLNTVDSSCVEAGLATVAMGRARQSAIISDKDRQTTAWHEAGHVVSAMTTPGAPPPVAVSILPRGQAGGVTWMSGDDDQYLSRSAAHAQLTVLLGGRAAEELLHGDDFTSGAANDLERATHLAVAMITRYGMTDLGLVVRSPDLPTGAEDSAITIKAESLLSDARAAASQAIADNRGVFDAVVAELLERETLDETDLAAIQARFEMDLGMAPDAADVPDICVGD